MAKLKLRMLETDKIETNQRRLADAFSVFRQAHIGRTILLDAHSVIDANNDLVIVPTEVIERLGLRQIIFVRDKPGVIATRRQRDMSRMRPTRSIAEISIHQNLALDQCQEYAVRLRIPLNLVSAGDAPGLEIAARLGRA